MQVCLPQLNALGRRQQVFRAITESALEQLSLACSRQTPRRRKGKHVVLTDLFLLAKSPAKPARDLPDMRHLFHRRTDKGCQAFPFWLPNNSKPATKLAR